MPRPYWAESHNQHHVSSIVSRDLSTEMSSNFSVFAHWLRHVKFFFCRSPLVLYINHIKKLKWAENAKMLKKNTSAPVNTWHKITIKAKQKWSFYWHFNLRAEIAFFAAIYNFITDNLRITTSSSLKNPSFSIIL